VQNDFLPGGRLAVAEGDQVVPVLNRYIGRFTRAGLPIFATRDWHPAAHCSFRERGGEWPPHCVAGTAGAAFAPDLRLPADVTVIEKGTDPDTDAYSGFEGTDLFKRLIEQGIARIFVGGLATDYCVLNTVKDAVGRGLRVVLLLDAIRAVNVRPRDGAHAESEMQRLGAVPTRYERLAP
jgi:nicotinamidase/pyrazinamidase